MSESSQVDTQKKRILTLAVPCYNEQAVIEAFYHRCVQLRSVLPDYAIRMVFSDNNSSDETGRILDSLADADPLVAVLHLAKNQGHQANLSAALDYAEGDIIVTIDADLQDPPEVIPELVRRIENGADIVHAQRISRGGETLFKRLTANLFYRLLCLLSNGRIIPDTGDFRAFTYRVLCVFRRFREPHKFLRGIFANIGFRQEVVPYRREPRGAGETKYRLGDLVRLAVNATLSFSTAPIRMILVFALILWASSIVYLVRALIVIYVYKLSVPGWTSLAFLQVFFSGLTLFCLAMIGAYIGRIFEQGQNRPLYWVRSAKNLPAPVRDCGYVPEPRENDGRASQ